MQTMRLKHGGRWRQEKTPAVAKRKDVKPHGGPAKESLIARHAEYDSAAKEAANERFDQDPLPIGIPEDAATPGHFSFEWENNPVSLKTEATLASKVVRRGEFGWLSDDRVAEIGEMVDDPDMTLDQALSLRSAMLQQKTVYSTANYRLEESIYRLYREGMSVVKLSKNLISLQ